MPNNKLTWKKTKTTLQPKFLKNVFAKDSLAGSLLRGTNRRGLYTSDEQEYGDRYGFIPRGLLGITIHLRIRLLPGQSIAYIA